MSTVKVGDVDERMMHHVPSALLSTTCGVGATGLRTSTVASRANCPACRRVLDAPQVYSIPEQPEGVRRVRVTDRQTGEGIVWFLKFDGVTWSRVDGKGHLKAWADLLYDYHSITVEPEPREPRTFPKLDPTPRDLKSVTGQSGTPYRQVHVDSDGVIYYSPYGASGEYRALTTWQQLDGPLTEVFEEATGER